MSNNINQQAETIARIRSLFAAVVVVGCAFATVSNAHAQRVSTPTTDPRITPSADNSAFLIGRATGTQGYVCLPTSTGATTASWTINAARPEATLFQSFFGRDFQIITHFLSPNEDPNAPKPVAFGNATWQSSFDTSKVWAQVLNGASIPAGTDASCPNTGSIACLLLTAIGTQQGPTGGTILSKTTFIQRLNTKGGSAPDTGCSTSADVGKQALVPYAADYVFFRKDK